MDYVDIGTLPTHYPQCLRQMRALPRDEFSNIERKEITTTTTHVCTFALQTKLNRLITEYIFRGKGHHYKYYWRIEFFSLMRY